ncbi:MAG: hypothetical protein ACK478_03830 [Flavobacteriales bacterium]|jgi:hypothetical protein
MRFLNRDAKRWCLLALGVWMAICASAQFPYSRWMIQANAGPDVKGQWVFAGALCASGYDDWGVRAEWRDWRYASEHTPNDYEPGLCVWGDCSPRDHVWSHAVMVTRRWTVMPYWLECGLDAGPAFLIRKELRFTPNEGRGMFESNYLQRTNSAYGAAAAVRAHLDWFPSRYWGCSVGINTLFERTSRVAFDFAMQFGFTRFKGRR